MLGGDIGKPRTENSIIPLIFLSGIYQRAKRNIIGVTEHVTALLQNYSLSEISKDRLVILDDMFPVLLSAFRIAEYNAYLEAFDNAEVHSTGSGFYLAGEKRSFSTVVDEYARYYPRFKERVLRFNPRRKLHSRLAYTIFIHNAFSFIDIVEANKTPFVFTLYPGGGFQLYEEQSDDKLRRVCASTCLRKVIVTQRVSYEYLTARGFCEPGKVEFIYGGVLPSDRLARNKVPKKFYKQDKDTFDICFVAYKYMNKGIDKGYDVFVEVARLLSKTHKDIAFHVVGLYDESDIDIEDIKERIKFYGTRNTDFFSHFYSHMDIILSPNVPFVRTPGSFDGFPTGACAEAGLCGVAVFCTDILGQNIAFKNGEEIVIISRDVEEICSVIDEYYGNYSDLILLGKKGQEAFKRVLSLEVQMKPRLRILSEWMA